MLSFVSEVKTLNQMPKYPYKCVIAIDTSVLAADADAFFGKLKQLVEAGGGTVQELYKAGSRRLAFKVKGKTEGNFFELPFDAEPAVVRELEAYLRLQETVLRFMTTREVQSASVATPPASA